MDFEVKQILRDSNGCFGLRLIQAAPDTGHEVETVMHDRRRFPAESLEINKTGSILGKRAFLMKRACGICPQRSMRLSLDAFDGFWRRLRAWIHRYNHHIHDQSLEYFSPTKTTKKSNTTKPPESNKRLSDFRRNTTRSQTDCVESGIDLGHPEYRVCLASRFRHWL